ncbi:glycosyltransferase family 2 protein [Flavobacterium aquidurense]|uniref:glycosyltransferase family 2 protein n=1 Tax=Flavobacterium aquidurense TaxID=362413 RepID=UPI003756C0DA
MEESPLISVIVLCYNQENTIGRTLDSILNQKTKYSYEIIIGEDASPRDNTRAVCEDYAKKYPEVIHLLDKESNKGILKNYSDCILQSRGKYIATCAGDDWWSNEDKLELQVSFLESNDDYGIVYTDLSLINVDTGEFKIDFNRSNQKDMPSGYIYKELILENKISACTALFRKQLFLDNINLIEFKSLGFLMEDYPMWLELSQHTKFKYIPVSTSTYSIADGSLSNNNEFKKIEEFELNCNIIRTHYIKKYPLSDIDEAYLQRKLYKTLILRGVVRGDYKEARLYVKKIPTTSFKDLIFKIICSTPAVILFSKYLKHINCA